MIDPVALTRLFAGQDRQAAVQEIAEGQARSIDIPAVARSEEHTSELQSLMRISYAVFCLKKKKKCNTQYYRSSNYIDKTHGNVHLQYNTTNNMMKNRRTH